LKDIKNSNIKEKGSPASTHTKKTLFLLRLMFSFLLAEVHLDGSSRLKRMHRHQPVVSARAGQKETLLADFLNFLIFVQRGQPGILAPVFGSVEFVELGVEGQGGSEIVVEVFDGLEDGVVDSLNMGWKFGGVDSSIGVLDIDLVGTAFLDGGRLRQLPLEEAHRCAHLLSSIKNNK
jgi:hypothetical protein